MSSSPFHVRIATVDEIVGLRHAVLRHGLPAAAARFDLDAAPGTLHAAAVVGDGVVGCGTFVRNPLGGVPAWQLRGMAVDPAWRGAGVGGAVLTFLERQLASDPVRLLWCNARTPAVRFYERHGWRVVSDEFFIETAGPHFRMTKGEARMTNVETGMTNK